MGFRWSVLVIVLFNTFFNTLYNLLGIPGADVKEVSATYSNLFTPAGYAFAIWGIIYLAFIVYAIYQLLPARRHSRFFDRMAWPVMLANLLCIIWQVIFRNYLITGSVAIILATLSTAALMQVMVRRKTNYHTTWLTVPFSLFLGWICVATIANISAYLVAINWNGFGIAESTWAMIMIIVALLTGIILSLSFRDYVVPLVIAWALIAIYVARMPENKLTAQTAIVSAVVSLLWATGSFVYQQKRSFSIDIHHEADA